jgi:hypothetical protein
MRRGVTRRVVLKRAGLVAGSAALADLTLTSGADAATKPTAHPAVVTRGGSETVQVEGDSTRLRLEGFPPGWNAMAGDRVFVAPSLEAAGVSVQPVCHWVSGKVAPADLRSTASLPISGSPTITDATVLDLRLLPRRRAGDRTLRPVRVAVADRATPGPRRVIAIREA